MKHNADEISLLGARMKTAGKHAINRKQRRALLAVARSPRKARAAVNRMLARGAEK